MNAPAVLVSTSYPADLTNLAQRKEIERKAMGLPLKPGDDGRLRQGNGVSDSMTNKTLKHGRRNVSFLNIMAYVH